jgi:hypothetical protein
MYYTYLWLRENGTPYYVGKGSGVRAFTSWAHGVHKPADKERILVQEFESEKEAFEAEKFLIAYYGRLDLGTGCLRNLTDGGENPPRTKLGRCVSQRRRRLTSATLKRKGIVPPNRKGVPHTQEVKDRIAASMRIIRRTQSGK